MIRDEAVRRLLVNSDATLRFYPLEAESEDKWLGVSTIICSEGYQIVVVEIDFKTVPNNKFKLCYAVACGR